MWHIIIFQVLQMISKWNINSILNLTNIRRHFEIWEKKLQKKMRFEKIYDKNWDSKKNKEKKEIRKKYDRLMKQTKKEYQNNWKKIYGKMIVKLNRGTDSLNCIKWVWRIIIKTREKERKINAKKMKLIQ